MSTRPKGHLVPEQYLDIERNAEYKSEYYAGGMFAMSGARAVHCDLVANLNVPLGSCPGYFPTICACA